MSAHKFHSLYLSLRCTPSKSDREEVFQFKDVEAQRFFKKVTTDINALKASQKLENLSKQIFKKATVTNVKMGNRLADGEEKGEMTLMKMKKNNLLKANLCEDSNKQTLLMNI